MMFIPIRWARRLLMAMSLITATPAVAFDHRYVEYEALLQRHVRWIADGHSTAVDYAGLKQDRMALASVSKALTAVPRAEFERWNRHQRMAFLINAYNAFTLELILTRYPDLKSIRDLGTLLRSPWKQSFFGLLGEPRTLDWIEHEQLRPVYGDARVHFGINCASVGCPALRPEAFVADKMDAQLDDQMRRFLGDRTRNRFNAADGVLSVSAIFKWFAEDFDSAGGGLHAWLSARAEMLATKEADRARLRRGDFELRHLSYDWSLNALGTPDR